MPRAAAFFGVNKNSSDKAGADNSASVYNGRGWIGRQDGLSQDDVAARRHKV
jgi:hypothetical protein